MSFFTFAKVANFTCYLTLVKTLDTFYSLFGSTYTSQPISRRRHATIESTNRFPVLRRLNVRQGGSHEGVQ